MAPLIATICATVWVLCCAFFSFIERPGINTHRWQSSLFWYHKLSTRMTPFLVAMVFLGSAAGIFAWSQNKDLNFLAGATFMLVMFPTSAVFVVTDTRESMESMTDVYGEKLKGVFNRWFYIHMVRTVLALAALYCFVSGMNNLPETM